MRESLQTVSIYNSKH